MGKPTGLAKEQRRTLDRLRGVRGIERSVASQARKRGRVPPMAGKQALLEKLRQDAPGVKTVEEHLQDRKREWLADLDELMGTLAGWLADGEHQGLLRIERRDVEVAEEDLGPYSAPALSIRTLTAHPRTIQVQPRGLRVAGVIAAAGGRIVGAHGRVDITCGAGRMILLRMREPVSAPITAWKLVLSDGKMAPLTEDAFSEALTELLE